MKNVFLLLFIVLFSFLIYSCKDHSRGTINSPEIAKSFDSVKQSALEVFLGNMNYNETTSLTLSDHIFENRIIAHCRSVTFVKDELLSILRDNGFKVVKESIPYPKYNIYLLRKHDEPVKTVDIVVFYFWINKTPGIDCEFIIGAFARKENNELKIDKTLNYGLMDDIHFIFNSIKHKLSDNTSTDM